MAKAISIVGGGLAGLTLGILLRQRGTPVTIWEATDYPRHRVCGEFISGSGVDVLQQIGLLDPIKLAGGRVANSAIVFDPAGRTISFELPKAALCISRYRLDALLAEHFEAAGGILKIRSRWKEGFAQPGIIRATGRKPLAAKPGAWKWFGLKVHCRNVPMGADLEIHFRHDGYAGLCRLGNEEVNLCGIFRSRVPVPALASEWKEFFAGKPSTPLYQKLHQAVYDETSFRAIAALNPNASRPALTSEIQVGDALGMIPPVTGNGMSIAFESAATALAPLIDYSQGASTWPDTASSVQRHFSNKFSRRLKFARTLHPFIFNGLVQRFFCSNPVLGRMLLRKIFNVTR